MRKNVYSIYIKWMLTLVLSSSIYFADAHIHFMECGTQLSNCSNINSILQDSQGYIWISSDYGLNRILGSSCKTFIKHSDTANTLSSNSVISLYEDSQRTLWVGTSVGLHIYNPKKENFMPFEAPAYLCMRGKNINDIVEDKQQNIWVIINNEYLMRINATTHETEVIESDGLKKMSPRLLHIDRKNRIWVFGRHTQVGIFNSYKKEIEVLPDNGNVPENIRNQFFCAISPDNQGNILASTLDGGLYSVNTENLNINFIENANKLEISKNINSIFKDTKGNIWIGTDGYGLWQYDEGTQALVPYDLSNLGFNPRTGKIRGIYEDKNDNIYIPFMEKGVAVIMSPDNAGFNSIKHDIYSEHLSFCEHSILSLLFDRQDILWVGTNGGGLYLFEKNKNSYRVKEHLIPNEKVITSLYEDSRGRILVGTYLHGFYIYDKGKLKQYKAGTGKNSINSNHVISFSEDSNSNIWIATNGGGISIMDSTGNIFKHLIEYREHKEDITSKPNTLYCLPNNYCNCIYWDERRMWIGTSFGVG